MIRPLARGVIVYEDRVLLTMDRLDDDVYLLPGGEPRAGEAITAALTRHAAEQTGHQAVPHELLWIRETLGEDHGLPPDTPGSHLIEFFYKCTVSGAPVAAPPGREPHHPGVKWVDRDRLLALALRPRSLKEPLSAYLTDRDVMPPVYAVENP